MFHICPRLPHQPFFEPPFEEEILAFLCFLGHGAVIRKLTDVNINKLHQPWRAFAAIINKCLTRKSSGYDSLRLNTNIQIRAMRCIILGSRRLSSTTSCQMILLLQGETRNSKAYKEYYAVAIGATPPKPTASVQKTKSSFDTTITPPTAAADEGTSTLPGVPDVPINESEEEISWNTTDEEGDDDEGKGGDDDDGGRDEESFDLIPKTPENSDDESNGEENLKENVGREERHDEEEEEDKLYRDVNINQGSGMESIFKTTSQMDAQTPTSVAPLPMSAPTLTSSTIATITTTQQAPTLPKTTLSTLLQDLPNFGLLNLYKALVEAYESDKIILDTYRETVTLKRRHDDDADKDEEPFDGSNRGSKRRREGKEPESASAPYETATRSTGRSTQGSKSRQTSASKSAAAGKPMQTTFEMEEPSHPEFETGVDDQPMVESVDTLTSELLAGPTYELLKGSCKSLVELKYHLEEVYKATTDQLDWVNPEADYGHIKWIEDLVPRTMWIQEPIGYDKHALWGVSHWRRKHQQFYGFAVNQSLLAMCILSEESSLSLNSRFYQKKLNLTNPDTYHSDLTRKEAYIAYSNPRGFIYQNKDKQNRLMRIDELHKFSDGTLTNVRTALDDRLKGIRMQYLPQSI
nr:hypothetical protein [Tanacetum cinerariifolium]